METIYLAGGCFWGLQKFFDQFDGVAATEVGYANGPDRPPTYTRTAIVTFPKGTSVLNMGVISR